jgi:hypothetical protein
MSPILTGVVASGISGNLTVPSSYESIQTFLLTDDNSSSITFSSIPSTYKNLQIRVFAAGQANTNVRMRFNGDGGSSYSYHLINGGAPYGATPGFGRGTSQTSMLMYDQQLGNNSYYNVTVTDVIDYSSTTKNKSIKTISGADNNSGAFMYLLGGTWYNTSAVNSITIFPFSNNFFAGSNFALYGIKG